MSAWATADDDRGKNARPARCLCGAPMPPRRPTGRPRLSCSLDCARKRDHLIRMVRRREEWLTAWHAEATRAAYTRARIESEVWTLRAELQGLLRVLLGNDGVAPSASSARV